MFLDAVSDWETHGNTTCRTAARALSSPLVPYPPYAMVGFSTGVHGVVGENGWAVFATFTADRYTEFAKITIREKRVPWCNSRNSAVTWRAKDGYVQIRDKSLAIGTFCARVRTVIMSC
jgi:hypothetical protein